MSDYRQKGTGKVITEEQLTSFAKNNGLSKEDYIIKAGLTLVTEASVAPGKEMGVTTNDAEVAPQEIPTVSTGLASEDTSLVSPEPRRSGRKQQREAELERIEKTPKKPIWAEVFLEL